MGIIILMLLALLALSSTGGSARVVAPDIAGMVHSSTSSISRHVQFGDLGSASPTAYEFVASSADSIVCSDARLCLQLKVSSVFETDPFFLHQYDSNYPVISATFDMDDSSEILPLIPGGNEVTTWWFQSNATETGPVIDLLLRLRQRSQRLSARDQLLVVVRVQLEDTRTITSSIEAYGMYGSQWVTHTTRRGDGNTVRVALSITKNTAKRDVVPLDAYPLVTSSTTDTDSSSTNSSCDACDEFLDSCRDSESCQTMVLPCLITQLKILASGEGERVEEGSDSVDTGDVGSARGSEDMEAGDMESTSTTTTSGADGRKEVDFLKSLAACVADLPLSTWSPIRHALFCLANSACPLGISQANNTDNVPTSFRLTNGTQNFVVIPTTSGTDNVDLRIVKRDIRESVTSVETFPYSASASYLGLFLRSFVLFQAAKVSVLVEPDNTDPSALQLTLTYSDALIFHNLSFYTATGQFITSEKSPPEAVLDFPASSSRPALDTLIDKLQARVKTVDDHSWTLAADCVSCSSQLFGCPTEEITNRTCNYNTAASRFGQCIRQELPPSQYETLTTGNIAQRRVSSEITRCLKAASSNTDHLSAILDASSSLACFSATRCPFGPVALVEDTQMIVLDTSSCIQLLRVSSSVETASIKIKFSVGGLLVATTTPISPSSSEDLVGRVINDALYSLTGIKVGGVSSSTSNDRSEWTLEIIYHHAFLPTFAMEAVINDNSLKADAVKQVVMEGGPSQLRVVPRDNAKIFKGTSTSPGSGSPSTDTTPNTSSPYSRLEGLSATDSCRRCQTALARCQNDPDCSTLSKNLIVPFLRSAMPAANGTENDPTRLEVDLTSVLRSIPSSVLSTSTWHAFTAELICLAQFSCELGYDSAYNYGPSFLNVGKIAVIYRVCTFADTKWRVTVHDMEFLYSPTSDNFDVAIPAFHRWIEELGTNVPFEFIVRVGVWDGTVSSGAASFDVEFYGGYESVTGRFTMLNPRLVPVFEVVGGTASGGVDIVQYAGASHTMWDIKLWSVGQSPQYNKLLDLLEIGLGGTTTTPTPSSTVASPTQEISSTDPCRKCSSVLARCQNDAGCVSLTRNALIPLLTSTQNGLQVPIRPTLVDDYGTAAFRGDFYPLMVLLRSRAPNTPTAWDLLASEFFCLAYDSCDMEYSDVYVENTVDHVPMNLELVRSSVNVELRTYANTEWNIYINTAFFSYKPNQAVSSSIEDSTLQFQKWLEALGSDESVKMEIQVPNRVVNIEAGSAVLSIRFFGSFDDELNQYMMVNPMMIPNIWATGGTVDVGGYFSRAEANVTFPSLVISSTRQKPQYSKMLKMLSDGIDSPTPTPAPTPTPTSVSRSMLSDDTCRQCEDSIALCRDDSDCGESSRYRLVPLLRDVDMAVSTHAENEYGSARVALNLTTVLLTSNLFLTRRGWDLFANELACYATSCDLEYADVVSPFLGFHIPTSLSIAEESVIISLCTYADTAWSMWLNNELLSYTPDSSDPMMIYDAAAALYDWIEAQLSLSPYNLVVVRELPDIDSDYGAATIRMSFHGPPVAYGKLMAPPWLIPRFEIAGGTTGGGDTGLPVAEANVTPWEISMVSRSQRPQYGKFLDLFVFGLNTPT
ncbi:hypothetical protein PC129_g13918 [Phytophthora cactorum]|uniref:Uncharacterized protein n=1 Tax=Phytophthora cactorum TaxID=29920 RepID=A0A329RZT8_9STRA|nr:hypothetical protein Pcac1_g18223 [Phytophthora cactorum]KAG2809212.1 hypothetical protein PC112_g16608 [Phytophthora cactorum]KAG2822275.1 hypothetical protein PC111_g10694 [Phytophthora cactorum]KAG2888733.1 hypothetical protein PC114_g18289 [Phytophthora cactorum]KAG2923941.1 hypothetical protein PC117_g15557 [Phytophthora cactorum]